MQKPLKFFAWLYSQRPDCGLAADTGPGIVITGGQPANVKADLIVAFLKWILLMKEWTAKAVQKVNGEYAGLRAVAVQCSFLLMLMVEG